MSTTRQRTLPVCVDGENWEDMLVSAVVDSDATLEVLLRDELLVACAGMDVVLENGTASCIVLCSGERPLLPSTSHPSSCVRLPFPLDATMPRLPWCVSLLRDDGHHDITTSTLGQILMQTPRVPLSPRRRLAALERSRALSVRSGALALPSLESVRRIRRPRPRPKPAVDEDDEMIAEEDENEGELSDAGNSVDDSADSTEEVDEDEDESMSCDEDEDDAEDPDPDPDPNPDPREQGPEGADDESVDVVGWRGRTRRRAK